jgi:hypothetical protein
MRRVIALIAIATVVASALVVGTASVAQAAETTMSIGLSASPNRVARSGLVTYSQTIQNFGPGRSRNAVTTQTIAVGSSLESYVFTEGPVGSCTGTSTNLSCALGDLDQDTTVRISLDVRMPATATSHLPVASVSATNSPGDSTDGSSNVRTFVGGVDLDLSTNLSGPLRRGTPFDFGATVTNLNYDAAPDSTLAFPLPAGVEYTGFAVAGGTAACALVSDEVSCLTGPIAGRIADVPQSVTLTIQLVAPSIVGDVSFHTIVTTSVTEFEIVSDDGFWNNEEFDVLDVGPALDEVNLSVAASDQSTVPRSTATT